MAAAIARGRTMKFRKSIGSALLGLYTSTAAFGNTHTAVVDKLQIHTPTNMGYVHLAGSPTFDGDGCTQEWAVGDLDDPHFMIYIWPMLLSTKNKGVSVTVNVSGCVSGYTKIVWAQVNAT